MATAYCWRGMTSLSLAARARPRPSALSRWTMHEKASTDSRVDEQVQLDHVGVLVTGGLVIHGAVAAREALDAVVEVDEDFIERQQPGQHDPAGVQGLGLADGAAFIGDQGHHVADVFVGADDEGLDQRFPDGGDEGRLRQEGGVIDLLDGAVGEGDAVNDAGIGGDDVHAVFAAQPFLDDLEVQQAQEAAAKAETEGDRGLGLINEGGVVELKLGEVGLEVLVIRGVDRVNAAEDHRMDFLEAAQHGRGVARIGDGVAHFHLLRALDIGRDVAGLPHFELLADVGLGIESADFLDLDVLAGVQELDLEAGLQLAVEDAHERDHALVGVEIGVDHERLERGGARRLGGRDAPDDGLEDLVDADAFLGARQDGRVAGDGQDVFQLLAGLGHVGVREVDFVDDRDDGQVLFHGQVDVGDGLGLDPLGGVHHQQGPLARAEAARDFVRKIHVAGRVDQVQLIDLPVLGLVTHRHRMRFDRDATLLLEVHRVEQLVFHLTGRDRARAVQQPVGQRRLPMVDMGDDAEVSYVPCVHLFSDAKTY